MMLSGKLFLRRPITKYKLLNGTESSFRRALISNSGHLRYDYLIKYAYFDKMLFRTVCFYQ